MSELTERTIFEHAEALRKKEYSSVQLTQAYLEQIDKKDKIIGAYITVTADRAIESAKAFDEGRCSDSEISPLAGIPCGIKDNMCTKGIKTTCASKMLGGYIPPYSAHVVEKLEKSGAVILGKLIWTSLQWGQQLKTRHSRFAVTPWIPTEFRVAPPEARRRRWRRGRPCILLAQILAVPFVNRPFLRCCRYETYLWQRFSIWTCCICFLS